MGGCQWCCLRARVGGPTPPTTPTYLTIKPTATISPPGTGKTLSARAVANRTDACFIRVIGSELVQKYVGEGARMVRELFTMARCVIL